MECAFISIFNKPALYFSKWIKSQPLPIWQLIQKSKETVKTSALPHNTPLMRSLAKGHGILKKNRHGLTYLDIEERFITAMRPYLRIKKRPIFLKHPQFLSFSEREAEFRTSHKSKN